MNRYLLAIAVSFLPRLVYAQPSELETKVASEQMDRGIEAVNAGDYEAARVYFKQAYSAVREPHALWNLAMAEKKSGRYILDAVGHFREYLADARISPEKKRKAEAMIRELSMQTARLRFEAAGNHEIHVGSKVLTSEEVRDGLDVLPGKYEIEARLNGRTSKQEIDAPAGRETSVRFADPSSPQPPPNSAPSARTVQPREKMVTVGALGVLGVASIATGIAFTVAKGNAQDRVNRHVGGNSACRGTPIPEFCGSLDDDVRSVESSTSKANILLGVGIGALVSGAAVYLLWPKTVIQEEKSSSSIRFVPSITPRNVSFTATASF
ncbi:hypothetical protein [Pendulispora albinea]|uniref:Tetratricopeptide repeat protein n=1 Tax=Pendulispora albinea TaxID=2741071 RepID=A0ABZ2LSM2_9BACT